MELNRVLLDFFMSTAVGAASVLLIIFCVGLGIPRRSALAVRRNPR